MNLPPKEKGKYPKWAWPGGYPIFYMTEDNAVLCPDCANRKNGSIASAKRGTDPQWHLVAADVNWEDDSMYCEHCNKLVESAYGDPDEKKNNPGNDIDDDFVQFCRQATDRQLENILAKEYDAHGHRDYASAVVAAEERGWAVSRGERIG